MAAALGFSAQMGGGDADRAVSPHFNALKKACKGVSIAEFPFPQLAFILRVDGVVQQYGLSGPGAPAIDRKKRYFSVDIGLQVEDGGISPRP
jgi:hypothetical protein